MFSSPHRSRRYPATRAATIGTSPHRPRNARRSPDHARHAAAIGDRRRGIVFLIQQRAEGPWTPGCTQQRGRRRCRPPASGPRARGCRPPWPQTLRQRRGCRPSPPRARARRRAAAAPARPGRRWHPSQSAGPATGAGLVRAARRASRNTLMKIIAAPKPKMSGGTWSNSIQAAKATSGTRRNSNGAM